MLNICAFCGPAAGLIISLFNSGTTNELSAHNMNNVLIEGVDEIHCTEGFQGSVNGDNIRVQGVIETPSIGHIYSIENKNEQTTIKIFNPNMVAAQAIETLLIDFEVPLATFKNGKSIFVVDKNFNWGPSEFECLF